MIEKILLSFVIGALTVPAFTIAADRYGTKLSGLLSSFPATLAASLILLGANVSPEAAAEEAEMIPALMGFFAMFLVCYCLLISRGFWLALLASLTLWLVLSFGTLRFARPDIGGSLAIALVCFASAYYVLEHRLKITSAQGKRVTLTFRQLLLRMLSGGTIVSSSVLAGMKSSPVFAALFAAFPAITVATLIVLYQSAGANVSAAYAKSLMVSALCNSTALSVGVFLFFPRFGVLGGSAAALALLFAAASLCWFLLHRLMR